ncbi:MAG: CsbD family protein [Acidobacteriota bacterium]
MWNKDEVEGKGKEIKGSVKNKVGEWTNDPTLEEEGEEEEFEGKVQGNVGTAKRKVENFVDNVKHKVAGD